MGCILNGKCTSKVRLDGKIAVVTGCNTGIGKECVKDFYLRGASVIMACRNLEYANAAMADIEAQCKDVQEKQQLGTMRVVHLDLSNLQSVRKCAGALATELPKIDILLNNAGVMMCPEARTADGFEMQFGTNHLGHFLFTMLLAAKVVASDSAPARIVNVSSMAHFGGTMKFDDLNWERRSYGSIGAYTQSKLANILFTKELARRLEDAGVNHVHTYSLHPGIIQTELGRSLDQTFFKGVTYLFRLWTSLCCKSPLQGAQTSIYCSLDEGCAKETGLYYQECHVTRCSGNARNVDDAKRLWEESLKLTGLDANFNPFTTQ